MLEQVAANQTRFMTPGLAADPRGVAMGRFLAVLLPSIDRVVNLFAGLSERTSLDEILVALRIIQVKTPLRSREFLVIVPVNGSHAADSIAAVARLVGGLVFTGLSKHFVRYRDTRGPLGYDVDSLQGGSGDFVLYSADFVQSYTSERDLPFDRLALSLALRRDPDAQSLVGEVVLVRAVQGLWRVVLAYVHRSGVVASAATVELAGGGERAYLIRCEALLPRIVDLLGALPGVELYRLQSENVAVQLGYRHPVELASCASIFDEKHFYLMSGERGRVEHFTEKPCFVSAAALVSLRTKDAPAELEVLGGERPEEVFVPLKLVATSGRCPPLVASRIPLEEAWRFKKLVYLLPPTVLASCGFCVGGGNIFLFAAGGIDYLPLGRLSWQVAPGILVPQGFDLLPRVAPDVLTEHLGASHEVYVFLTQDEPGNGTPGVIRVPREAFAPLGRATLAELPGRDVDARAQAGEEPAEVRIVNDEVEAFALWSFEGE
ncbi:MAG: hypothetical protein JRH20_10110 [Deltaproteobacteria bacterium]|nr:hypothetical protein [Deltaproteobacteria bacterium]